MLKAITDDKNKLTVKNNIHWNTGLIQAHKRGEELNMFMSTQIESNPFPYLDSVLQHIIRKNY